MGQGRNRRDDGLGGERRNASGSPASDTAEAARVYTGGKRPKQFTWLYSASQSHCKAKMTVFEKTSTKICSFYDLVSLSTYHNYYLLVLNQEIVRRTISEKAPI